MQKIFSFAFVTSLSLLGLPSLARAHDEGYRVCRDADGDRVPCRYRVCRDEDGDRIPCRRVSGYARPGFYGYSYGAPYGFYGGPRVIIGGGPRYYRRW